MLTYIKFKVIIPSGTSKGIINPIQIVFYSKNCAKCLKNAVIVAVYLYYFGYEVNISTTPFLNIPIFAQITFPHSNLTKHNEKVVLHLEQCLV